jgi:hypothetical protein
MIDQQFDWPFKQKNSKAYAQLFGLSHLKPISRFPNSHPLRVAAALERQTKPFRISPPDERAGKKKECLMNVAPLLLTDAECANTEFSSGSHDR